MLLSSTVELQFLFNIWATYKKIMECQWFERKEIPPILQNAPQCNLGFVHRLLNVIQYPVMYRILSRTDNSNVPYIFIKFFFWLCFGNFCHLYIGWLCYKAIELVKIWIIKVQKKGHLTHQNRKIEETRFKINDWIKIQYNASILKTYYCL